MQVAIMPRPIPNQDEQESQIIAPWLPDDENMYSDGLYGDFEGGEQDKLLSDNTIKHSDEPEHASYRSRVEETQFTDLEKDNQAESPVMTPDSPRFHHDNFQSRIEDTQFAALEEDTQSVTQPVHLAAERGAGKSHDSGHRVTGSSADSDQPSSVAVAQHPKPHFQIQCPVVDKPEDIAASFKMGAASKSKFSLPAKSATARVQHNSSGSGLHTQLASTTPSGSLKRQAVSLLNIPTADTTSQA